MAQEKSKSKNWFSWLETSAPAEVKESPAPPRERFGHLEVGEHLPPAPPPAASPTRDECVSCGQANELERDFCWACGLSLLQKPFEDSAEELLRRMIHEGAQFFHGARSTVIQYRGKTYTHDEPDLPENISSVLKRIREGPLDNEILRVIASKNRLAKAKELVSPTPEVWDPRAGERKAVAMAERLERLEQAREMVRLRLIRVGLTVLGILLIWLIRAAFR